MMGMRALSEVINVKQSVQVGIHVKQLQDVQTCVTRALLVMGKPNTAGESAIKVEVD